MSKIIEAIYEEGVLKPLEPLNLEEHTKVRLQISVIQQKGKPLDPIEIEKILELARASIEGLSEEELAIMESTRFDNRRCFSDSGESK